MNKTHVGLVGFSTYVPEKKITSEELAKLTGLSNQEIQREIGIKEKYIGGEDDHAVAMSVKAAKSLLNDEDIDPASIDMILYCGETYCEYMCWTGAIKIQKEISATNAYAWDLGFRCAATPLGIKVAKDMMLSDPELKNVLLVGGNTNAYLIDYQDPYQKIFFDMGPAAMAILLRKNHSCNEILESSIITDSSCADDAYVEYGGSKKPITREILEDPDLKNNYNLLKLSDPKGLMKRISKTGVNNMSLAIKQSMEKSQQSEIDYLAFSHVSRGMHVALLKKLGVPADKCVYLDHEGHCGHADQLLSLQKALDRQLIKEGDTIVLAGPGTGFAYASSVIRWGPVL